MRCNLKRSHRLLLSLAAISAVAVLAAVLWMTWSQTERREYVTLRGELLALSIQDGPTIYYISSEGAELLIRLELENVGAVDVGPYIGKQIQVEGYLHDEEPQHPWIDVRVLKLAPAY
ncbi:MAG: hypothetical protein QW786_03440 [Candidatus Hadarchaeum sp.]